MRWRASARRRLPRDARSSTPNRSILIVWSQWFGGYWMAANEPLVSREYTGQHASTDAPQPAAAEAAAEASVTKTRRRCALMEYTAFCNGPGDVKSPRVIVAPPSSRFCPWSALRPPHYAVRRNGEPI